MNEIPEIANPVRRFDYEFEISIDLGNAIPEVGALLQGVNDEMASLGCSERLVLRNKLIRGTIETERELTPQQMEEMKTVIVQVINERQPAWKAKVESFRRKSGNVLQSANP